MKNTELQYDSDTSTMLIPCPFSEMENTTFVLSASDLQGRFQIRKQNKTLFLCRDGVCWKTEHPLATLSAVLKTANLSLLPNTFFVHPTEYMEYPTEYALHCALHHLPPMWGIQKT